jgi:uncharacterized repeat protein (TIGR04138 family)
MRSDERCLPVLILFIAPNSSFIVSAQGDPVDPRILELVREDRRYSYEAYEFVCEAVTHTQSKLGRAHDGEGEEVEEHHVSGAELLRGACELAVRDYGMMASVVFKLWGLRSTDDFGEIVFKLIRVERLSKSEQDDIDDFHDLFDLEKALQEGSMVSVERSPRRGER